MNWHLSLAPKDAGLCSELRAEGEKSYICPEEGMGRDDMCKRQMKVLWRMKKCVVDKIAKIR
jgi:hypothetical protein